jgi:hypothetical protein
MKEQKGESVFVFQQLQELHRAAHTERQQSHQFKSKYAGPVQHIVKVI